MAALYHVYTQTVADGTATSVVRPSDWNSAHIQGQTISGNTSGVSAFSGTNIALQGGNNITLSAITAANAATIVISGANSVAQSVQTQASGAIAGTGFTSATTAGTAIVATQGTNGLSMAVPQFITTYVNDLTSGRAGTGFTSTTTAGTAITAALGTNGLSMAVPAYLTTYSQSVQTQASGAIAGTGFTSATTAGTAITAAMGTNGLNMAVPAYLTTYVAQTTQTQPAGNIAGAGYTSTTQAGSTVGITQNSNGLSAAWPPFITTAAQSVQTQNIIQAAVIAGNTSGTTASVSSGTVVLAGGNNITLSQSGQNITVIGNGGATISGFDPYNNFVITNTTKGNNTIGFDPIDISDAVVFDRFAAIVSVSSTGAVANTLGLTLRIGVYTQTGSTLSLLQSVSTSVSVVPNGTNQSLFTGVRMITISNGASTLTPGKYWIGSLSNVTSSATGASHSIWNMAVSQAAFNYAGLLGQSTNGTYQLAAGRGLYSVTSTALPDSVAFSQISGTGSIVPRAQVIRFTNAYV